MCTRKMLWHRVGNQNSDWRNMNVLENSVSNLDEEECLGSHYTLWG